MWCRGGGLGGDIVSTGYPQGYPQGENRVLASKTRTY